MSRVSRRSCPLLASVVAFCAIAIAASADDTDRALEVAGLSPEQIRIDPLDLNTFDNHPARLAIVEWTLANPLKAPVLGDYITDKCTVSAPRDSVDVLAQLSRWLGKTIRRGLIGDPLERAKKLSNTDDPIIIAVERAYRVGGVPLPAAVRKSIETQTAGVPPDELRAVALLLQTICDAHQWVDLALTDRPADKWAELLAELRKTTKEPEREETASPFDDFRRQKSLTDALVQFDPSLMFVGSQEIAFAVDALTEMVQKTQPPPTWTLTVPTPIGEISIGGKHRVAKGDAPLLLIDWAGSDTYTTLATTTAPNRRVSIAIDFDGDDHYVNTKFDGGNFASGQCGIAMLFDLAGNDEYRITRNGISHALFGVAMLFDAAGDDTYVAIEHAQAAAYAGAAVLIDVAGTDRYEIHTHGQAYAGPGGGAVLADVSGDDHYIANDTDIRFPSSQSDEHNNSLAQGAGFGWRADYQEGLSIPGGIGILFDGGGDDEYSCGIFGQGVGYWLGMGLLVDRNGNDRYKGQWYAQGASAHFAAGILLDREGDDHYEAHMNMAQGAGHDVGIGVLFDDAGNDRYQGPSLSLGAGNAAGLGLFVDRKGDDHYNTTGGNSNIGHASQNRTGTLRAAIPAIGLFLDLSGQDHYPQGRGGNATHWTSAPSPPDGTLPGIAHAIDK